MLLTYSMSFSQKGFDVIRKAEKKINQGNYNKALKLLNKADSMNYGFCGNAWMEARAAIAFNKTKIAAAQGEYLLAANELNKMSYSFYHQEDIDSLKMTYLLKTIDKEIMRNEIDSCLNLISTIENEYFYVGLYLDVDFIQNPFHITYETLTSVRKDTFIQTDKNASLSNIERFRASIRNQSFYRLLL